MDVILNINNLTYLNIFENLSIYLEKNKIITISGPNNCGKTTLFKILCKKIKGNFNIILNSKGIYEFSDKEYDDNIQVVYQDEKIISNNTVKELIDIQQERYETVVIYFVIKEYVCRFKQVAIPHLASPRKDNLFKRILHNRLYP